MTDREKLIEILGENISEYCRLSVIAGTTKITGVTLDAYRLADHLIANGVTFAKDTNVPSWIPVSERLPEDNLPRFSNVKQIKVLTALISDKGVRTVRSQMRYKDTWATGYQEIWKWKCSGSEITHWMPLPEPPKTE